MSWLVDMLLVLALGTLAWQAVAGRSLFRGIVMFIVFGLTMALAWARIGAPDLAMAEAAIGAGVTGALMLVAYRKLVQINPDEPADPTLRRSRLALPIAALSALLVAIIGLAGQGLDAPPALAGLAVLDELEATGLGNPITGVLLVFRNLDTLLEVAVLLTAFLAARAVAGEGTPRAPIPPLGDVNLVGALLSIIVPLTVLVAAHLLKAGSQEPGGAFQAGAVLAACGVLLLLAGKVSPAAEGGWLIRIGLLAGLVSFSLIGLGQLAFDQPLLSLPGLWAVYFIETAMMVSIALTLILLFAGAGGLRRTPT
jgi:multisubunit Na+/H+ antiporter MnhB subunit